MTMPSSREFEALFTAALDAVFVADDARVVVAVNPAACRLLGRPSSEVVGSRIESFLERPEHIDTAWAAFLAGGRRTGRLRLLGAGGRVREVEYSATAHFVRGRHLGILRDITERRAAEARAALRLRETETLLAVARTLSATLDPTETMRRVAREIAHAMKADMVGAYRADAGDNALWPVAGYRVPKSMLETFRQFPIPIRNHPAIEEAWQHRHAIWTGDMAADPRVHRATYERFPHQSDVFVPISIKDVVLTRGLPTLQGSRTVNPDQPWLDDAPAVARVREHGAVILGKTTTPELGHKFVTDSPLTGITRNPWNPERSPGGSSGGAAAAVAAGLGPLAVGTDGGGSIRIPSTWSGIVGHKPTTGRVPIWPPSRWGMLSNVGPMARTVGDAALLLTVLAGPDRRDPLALPPDGRDYRIGLEDGVAGLRIAYSPDLGLAEVEPEIAASVEVEYRHDEQ